jgi:ethanolamine utilization protein EutJ
VVDIGGGTTGLAVFQDGKAVYVADEPTGGTHISLVLMGGRKISFEQAEQLKQDEANHKEVLAATLPVMEKMAGIVKNHIRLFDVKQVQLVGGTCCMTGIEDVFTRILGRETEKPRYPMMVTPLGIALACEPG